MNNQNEIFSTSVEPGSQSIRPSVCSSVQLFWPNYLSICLHIRYSSYPPLGTFLRPKILWSVPPTSCPTQKLVQCPKMNESGCSLAIILSRTIGKPMESRFQKVKKFDMPPPTPCPAVPCRKIGPRPKNDQKLVFIKYVLFHWKAHG